MASTALIAVGMATLIAMRRWHDALGIHVAIVMVAAAGALFGAAAFLPFRRPFIGAVVGVWVILAVMLLTAEVKVRY